MNRNYKYLNLKKTIKTWNHFYLYLQPKFNKKKRIKLLKSLHLEMMNQLINIKFNKIIKINKMLISCLDKLSDNIQNNLELVQDNMIDVQLKLNIKKIFVTVRLKMKSIKLKKLK